MATGFMTRHCSALALALAALGAQASEVSYVGAIGDKAAILVIDGAAPRTVKVGQKHGAVTVLEVERERAVVEVAGERRVLQRGQHYQLPTGASDRQSTVLAADARGHFIADGAVNGNPVRFVVDTGATVVALPAFEARRLGIDYRKGRLYLPQDELRRFGISEHDIASSVVDDSWRHFVTFQIERTRALLCCGAPLGRTLKGRVGVEMRMIIAGGDRILTKIARLGGDVFRRRPVLRPLDWPLLLVRALR